jgi:hypothetical protein
MGPVRRGDSRGMLKKGFSEALQRDSDASYMSRRFGYPPLGERYKAVSDDAGSPDLTRLLGTAWRPDHPI